MDKIQEKTENVPFLYEEWFLDYASYVILERAIPTLLDGLKPVQRRILYSMLTMEDGRYNKVANLVGNTMQYHPHGDASITEALVNLGQKELLIDTQGNWGNLLTGDPSAAARYIEARLSPFAKEILFEDGITFWQSSYDGRKKEPITLPVRFPLLLALGVEGIAVGLSTKILPHNCAELLEASIDLLEEKDISLSPDFPQGGTADVSEYHQGKKGGKVRVRASIEVLDKKTIKITEIPFGTTTQELIQSILKAEEKNKISIKNVIDNTAQEVDITIHLSSQTSASQVIQALYAFTSCEITISTCACVIHNEKPIFTSVDEILREQVYHTRSLLEKSLVLRMKACQENIFFASLEKIFVEKRIYRAIESCTSFNMVLDTIKEKLAPHIKDFYRPVERDDLERLTEIRIKRISKYNSDEADRKLESLRKEEKQLNKYLSAITDYTIQYFRNLIKKYGNQWKRKTQLEVLPSASTQKPRIINRSLYVQPREGFIGYALKKRGEKTDRIRFAMDCADTDDILVIRKDTRGIVTRVSEKVFVGKNILDLSLYDKEKVYHMVYKDPKGCVRVKRFRMGGATREKEYILGSEHGVILYLSGDGLKDEVVQVYLSPDCSARKKVFSFSFAGLAIRGRSSQGNILSKYPVQRVRREKLKGAKSRGLGLL
ncbi:MAG: DNA gyrase/topoisomerase IV subunit A [Cytophagales bacterium]|nr:DNA gyrase/topoisomerase IV subunit A [Cytophagales bacterium]